MNARKNLRKEEERIGESEEEEVENAREKAEIGTISSFFSLYALTYFTSNWFPLK